MVAETGCVRMMIYIIRRRKTNIKKILYIIEYDNGNEIQSEWFVGRAVTDYEDGIKLAKRHLKSNDLDGDIINMYDVSESLIREVYKSYQEE